ncbi:bifunctional pyr operon transcriptional regulator/uracil phosphoribosyltransferase PyrR [PVC group bacterium]|nr:bifunctional pyr operon transcriptional regulator/uracil phosphoribosyltransferase PyrR [PVC group bacterium]
MKQINGLDKKGIQRLLVRMAHEIVEQNEDVDNLAIIGIQTGGAHLATRMIGVLKDITGKELPLGILDISLYRDDFAELGEGHPQLKATDILFDVGGKDIILVDDVLFTGRTIRAALDAIVDFGRPKVIQLAVLVDRGHREFPIKADFVGKNIPTSLQQEIYVRLKEEADDGVFLIEK